MVPARFTMDKVPAALFQVFFHDDQGCWLRWSTERIWALPTPVTLADASSLWWHLELPIWASSKASRFDTTPAEVLVSPNRYPQHHRRVLEADLSFPLELFENHGRWVIIDGYHRLARQRIERVREIPVRLHAPGLFRGILLEA